MAGLDQLMRQILGGSAGAMDISKLTALAQPLLQQIQSSGGLNAVLGKLQQAGLGDQVNSWLGQGGNESVDADKLAEEIGEDRIETLSAESGMSPDEVKSGLSQILPGLVDKMSPSGSLPTSASDLTGMLGQIPGGEQISGMIGGLLGGNK
ncbi:MAG: DUF937 domain-containing protein [Micrococcales bacterium]|nr:DUF937 domain-containing protein [Micrococcales bacterium]